MADIPDPDASHSRARTREIEARATGGTVCRQLPIVNKRGLHARASAKLVRLVESFEAEIWVEREGVRVPGHSIMGLMMLAAAPGTEITVIAAGPDADRALDAIAALVGDRFEEEE